MPQPPRPSAHGLRRPASPATATGYAASRRWIFVANRGPVEYTRDADGQRDQHRGSGGLVTALSALTLKLADSIWICAPRSDEDRSVALEAPSGLLVTGEEDGAGDQLVRFIHADPEVFEQYYSVISNPLIWFVQHNMWDLSNAPNLTFAERAAFDDGYRRVNAAFARAVIEAMEERDSPSTVMIHDYHLYLVGRAVRRERPHARLLHFVHIPWPQPEAWRVFPRWIRDELVRGLLGNDIVAFQTRRDVGNFLLTCEDLLGLRVDHHEHTVQVDDRIVAVRSYPISIDTAQMEALARSEQVSQYIQGLENVRREHLIVRVDRTDLSKNILRGFLAYDRLLEKHPDLAGRVTFLAFLQPSRQDVPQYAEYTDRILRLAADVNLKHGNVEWQPIDLRIEDNLAEAVAAYRMFDVLLVNPVYDGLNLVAKEGMLLNEREGVLVLSEYAGAHEELGEYALSVHPLDIEEQADALYTAIFMSRRERKRRRNGCVASIRRNSLDKWFDMQVRDLGALETPKAPMAG